MKLYDEISETAEHTLNGGETLRLRFRHEDFDTVIATENVSEDPEAFLHAAPIPAADDENALKDLVKKAEAAAEAVHEADRRIGELLRERAERVSEFLTLSRTLKLLEVADEIPSVELYDWRSAAPKEHEGREVLSASAEKQNRVYHAEITAYHEPMGEQARLSYRITPACGALSDGYSVAHKTKIPDYKSKEQLLQQFEEMKEQIDREFFAEENPVISRRYRTKFTVDGLEIPGYRYEQKES